MIGATPARMPPGVMPSSATLENSARSSASPALSDSSERTSVSTFEAAASISFVKVVTTASFSAVERHSGTDRILINRNGLAFAEPGSRVRRIDQARRQADGLRVRKVYLLSPAQQRGGGADRDDRLQQIVDDLMRGDAEPRRIGDRGWRTRRAFQNLRGDLVARVELLADRGEIAAAAQ